MKTINELISVAKNRTKIDYKNEDLWRQVYVSLINKSYVRVGWLLAQIGTEEAQEYYIEADSIILAEMIFNENIKG